MKKVIKILSILMFIIFICFILKMNIVLALDEGQGGMPNIDLELENIQMPSKMLDIVGLILGTIQTVGIVITIIVVLILGIKYIMASAEGKAEYKKKIILFLVGSIFLISSAAIVRLISNIVYNIF